jgi:hypothetical protein
MPYSITQIMALIAFSVGAPSINGDQQVVAFRGHEGFSWIYSGTKGPDTINAECDNGEGISLQNVESDTLPKPLHLQIFYCSQGASYSEEGLVALKDAITDLNIRGETALPDQHLRLRLVRLLEGKIAATKD